jgi:uncharacterized protein (TIGR02757 family)
MNSRLPLPVNRDRSQLRPVLEKLYKKYNRRELIKPDPLQFVYEYDRPCDMEIAGFVAAVLAYGRVAQIEKSVTAMLAIMGTSPYEFVLNFRATDRKKLAGFKHRFNTGDDLADLFVLLKKVIRKDGGLESFFLRGYNDGDKTVVNALSGFCGSLLSEHSRKNAGHVSRGLQYLLSDPAKGSACKRLNLFLRWMVRDDDVDPGLWKSVDKAKLIVPIDVHMGRLCKILNLYDRKTVSLKAAMEITEAFAQIEPADPAKYDFCLSRIGIVENCSGKMNEKCKMCELEGYCLKK